MAEEDRLPDERFQATMIAIRKHFEHEDFEKALPLCTKAAEVRPSCIVVRQCRIFALLSLNRWSDALQACEKLASSEEPFSYERAYCLYRLNQFDKALATMASAKGAEDTDRLERLEAQVRYRMGEYSASADTYEKLYLEDEEETGLLVNALAARISGNEPRQAVAALGDKEELLESSYELCFNLACAYLEENRLSEAQAKLEEAKKICIQELMEADEEEEEGDEEKEPLDPSQYENSEELAAIQVQTATVLQRLGGDERLKTANDLYTRVLKPRTSNDGEVDPTVLAVACNNLVALRPEGKSLFDSLKRLNVASKESWEAKLTHKQSIEISINKCLLLLQTRKVDQAKAEVQKLKTQFKDHPRVAVAQAAVAYKERKAKGAEEVLQAYLGEHPDSEEVLICLAQLQAQQNRFDKAAEALDQMSKATRAKPQNVEVFVSFYLRQKNPDKAVACFRDAISHWSGEEDEEMLAQVLKMSFQLALQIKDKAFAAEAYQLYLERIDGSDTEALCGLVEALASVDPQRAQQYAQRLPLPDYGHLDAEELESGAVPKLSAPARRGGDEGQTAEKQAPKKKKRKPRYPKNFDPENPGPPPDPERWLPKHERSEYKKKMRKRDKNLARGPQGAMVVDDKAFRKSGPSTAQIEVASDPNMARPKGSRNKKGKK